VSQPRRPRAVQPPRGPKPAAVAEPLLPPADSVTEAAWHAYRDALYRFVVKRVRDHTAAEDIVHDVLVKAYTRQETLRNPEKMKPWLYQITRNAIIDYYRVQKPSEALPDHMTREEQGARHAERELARCLIPLLEELPAAYGRPLRLADLEGVAQQDVAATLGLSLSGAKSRLQRGRKMLHDTLLRCCRVELDRRGGIATYEVGGSCGKGDSKQDDAEHACGCCASKHPPRR